MSPMKKAVNLIYQYVDSKIIPACFAVASAHGFQGSLQDFAKECKDYMENPTEMRVSDGCASCEE